MARDAVVEVEVALDPPDVPARPVRRRGPAGWLGAALLLVVLGCLAAPTWSPRPMSGAIPRWHDTAFTLADTTISWDAIPELPSSASGYLVSTLLVEGTAASWSCAPDMLDRSTIVCVSAHEVRDIRLAWNPVILAPEPR